MDRSFIARPRLAFRVGVTGTRQIDATANGELGSQVEAVLGLIRMRVRAVAAETAAAGIYAEGPPLLRLLSPLAEGADRLVAARALALGYRLEAPLPFSAGEYERDFPNSVPEFRSLLARAEPWVLALDGARGAFETSSYEAVGRLVVRNCDLLIAVWDGGAGNGKGGTAEIVRYALGHGQPVWWLHPDGLAPPVWLEAARDLVRPETCPRGAAAFDRLNAYLATNLLPLPQAGEPVHGLIGQLLHRTRRAPPASPLTALMHERKRPRHRIWGLLGVVLRWAAGGAPARGAPAPPAPPSPVWAYWQDFYGPLDDAAVSYANRYRSSYMMIFAFGALTLSCAVLGVGFHGQARYATSVELLLLVLVFAIVCANELFGWHPRFVAYRLLAELFRKQQALGLLARGLPLAETESAPTAARGDDEDWLETTPRDAVVGWYFKAAVRAAPLPEGGYDGASLRRARAAVVASLVTGQAEYHARRWRDASAGARRFGRLGAECFLATLVIVGLKFVLMWVDDARHSWPAGGIAETGIVGLGVAAALLPALAAAFVGIRGYAELELLADQSVQMQRLAREAEARLLALDPDAPLASETLGGETLWLAQAMLLDVKGWAQLIRVKAVEP